MTTQYRIAKLGLSVVWFLLHSHLLQQLFDLSLLSLFLCLVWISLQGIKIGLTSTCRGMDMLVSSFHNGEVPRVASTRSLYINPM